MALSPLAGQRLSAPRPGDDEEVRTLFILGFPADVKERELRNLLRFLPGFEECQMAFKGDQPKGFALFSSPASAMSALDSLQDLVFEQETNSVLRVEMAKRNLFVKKKLEGDMHQDPSKRMKTAGQRFTTTTFSGVSGVSFPGAYPSSYGGGGNPFGSAAWPGVQSFLPSAGYDPYPPYPLQHNLGSAAMAGPGGIPTSMPVLSPQNTKDNPPCNTLFVGNLGEDTSLAELRGLFSSHAGFRQLKVVRSGRSVNCFVEFGDVASAAAVHAMLQGAMLGSSDRGGMRIQFSKNPFGQRLNSGMGPVPGARTNSSQPAEEVTNGEAAAGETAGGQEAAVTS